MAIIKGSFETEFVTVYNKTARDTRLSLQARGLLLYLLSLPGDWKISRKQLAKDNGINDKTIQKQLNELKEHGYAYYQATQEKGRFTGGDYMIFPTPQKQPEDFIKKANPKTSQANKQRGSTGDPKSGSPVNAATGKQGQHTKKESYKEISAAANADPATPEPEFNFDLILAWIITQLKKTGHDLTAGDEVSIEAALHDYHDSASKPRRAPAFDWCEQALINRYRTLQRSARNGAARDKVSSAVVNQLETQASVIKQHTDNMKPRTMADRMDTSWADGLDLPEEA